MPFSLGRPKMQAMGSAGPFDFREEFEVVKHGVSVSSCPRHRPEIPLLSEYCRYANNFRLSNPFSMASPIEMLGLKIGYVQLKPSILT